jgi:hypothetical protein
MSTSCCRPQASEPRCGLRWLRRGWDGADLDHVPAAEHLEFKHSGQADVDVRGWPTLAGDAAQQKWNADFSDHALPYVEVQTL